MLEAKGVFHDGERGLHEKLGIGDRLYELGSRMIRDHMPEQHREFFAQLTSVHLGAVDRDGHPWAVMRVGDAGFMTSENERTLSISSEPLVGEPADLNLSTGAKVSVVGIEFETRRRNRVNATISASRDKQLSLLVDQSYGNCPKYIQVRKTEEAGLNQASAPDITQVLTPDAITQIGAADTLLIASRAATLGDDPRAGVDINHRGGLPGFVNVVDESTLQFPDYRGNNFYNTYGNIMTDSRVGLQFVDFETGTLLNVKGEAEVVEELNTAQMPLMGRGLRIHVKSVTRAVGALPVKYKFVEYSDRNPEV